MDKFINTSIYVTYIIIAVISIIISYKVSLVMSLIVLAIEIVRLMAIYKKVYAVIVLVFLLNTSLIGYNGYKSQEKVDYNNIQIQQNNEITHNYLNTNRLKASTVQDFKNGIQKIEDISIDWWLLVGVYLILEFSLILLIIGINKQETDKPKLKVIKKDKYNGKNKSIVSTSIKKDTAKLKFSQSSKFGINEQSEDDILNRNNKQETTKENLKYVGSYSEYYKTNNMSRSEAKKLFEEWKENNRLVKQNGKNYLKV